jgi:RimJ/RimL family protein N-acetyltransferase
MLEIRELKASDRKLIETFWNSLSADTLKWFAHYNSVDEIFTEGSYKLIGLESGKILVYGFLLPDTNFPDTPSLGIVALDSERKRGFGTAMMRRLEEGGKARGYTKIFLTVFIDNIAALSLYIKAGYEPQGIVKRKGRESYAMTKKIG